VTIVATPSGSTVSLALSKPMVVTGPVALVVEALAFVSQVVINPSLIVVTMSGAVAGMDYSLAQNDPNLKGAQGEGNATVAGTFP